MEKELRKWWMVRTSIHGIIILTNVGTSKMLQNAMLISLISLKFDMCLISDDVRRFCPISPILCDIGPAHRVARGGESSIDYRGSHEAPLSVAEYQFRSAEQSLTF